MGYCQGKKLLAELSVNTLWIGRTHDIDKYLQNQYSDYKTSFIISGGIGAAIGYNFSDKFSTFVDCSINNGGDYRNNSKKQFKRLESYTTALAIEYKFLQKERHSFSVKIGLGYDNTSFFYSRKGSTDIISLSYTNAFMPIAITWWQRSNFGISLQYNAVIARGNAYITGVDYKLDSSIPNVSLSNISLGLRYRF